MKICIFSDTHGKHDMLDKLPDADIAVCCGDITGRGLEKEAHYFMEWYVNQWHIGTKIFIPGNHDFCFENGSVEDIPSELTCLVNEPAVIDGLHILAMSYVPIFRGWAFEVDNSVVEDFLNEITVPIDLLITHTPPHSICDFTQYRSEHAGSPALFDYVMKNPPKVHCFGHIHEGYGQVNNGRTTFVNASVLNGKYYLTNKPIVIEI